MDVGHWSIDTFGHRYDQDMQKTWALPPVPQVKTIDLFKESSKANLLGKRKFISLLKGLSLVR